MDVCDSTFSNTTTFKSLPQAFHKTQACTCLTCSLKLSSAAQGEGILPTRPSDLQGRKPQQTHHAAQQWDPVLWCSVVTHSQGLETSAGWLTGCPRSTRVSILGLSHHLQCTGVHLGLVPLLSSYKTVPICFTTSTGWFNLLFRQEKGFW